jgi:hypothetical protein
MEGQGFNADLYINGVKSIFIIDNADGGCFNYLPYTYDNPKAEEVKKNIGLLEAHIKTLPKVKSQFTFEGSNNPLFDIEMDMDMFIDELINKIEREKQEKKKLKLMETSLLFGVPNGNQFSYIQFKTTLANIPKPILQAKLLEYKSKYCKGGVVLLNTNIEALGLKL